MKAPVPFKSAYAFYVVELKETSKIPIRDLFQMSRPGWDIMNDYEKDLYHFRAMYDKKRFDHELREWKSLGH